jgi:Ser/Thr protein kinase RdoA (MazF antagonist)
MASAPQIEFPRSLLNRWPSPFASATVIDRQQGFSGALVFRIVAAEQEFAVRGWPPGSMPRTRLAGLHQFLRYLHQQGLSQVSVPIPTAEGATFVEESSRWWQLEPWLPGEASFAESPTCEKLRAVMQLLARLHHLAERYESDDESAAWFAVQAAAPSPAVIERVRLIELWKDTNPQTLRRLMQNSPLPQPLKDRLEEVLTRFHRHADVIQTELQSLLASSFRLQPCVRDLWHDHVLFTGDEVTGLIDFGACRSENPMIDLSRLLGSFFPEDASRWQEALDVYESFRSIRPEERQLLRAFDRSQRLLAGMMWIQRLIVDGEVHAEPQRIEKRLDTVLAGMRPLDVALT